MVEVERVGSGVEEKLKSSVCERQDFEVEYEKKLQHRGAHFAPTRLKHCNSLI
jgi:hypothetical protein